jgi:hypothetical protein
MYFDILNGLTVVGYGISTFAELAPQYWSSPKTMVSLVRPSVNFIAIISNFVFSGQFGKEIVEEVVFMYSAGLSLYISQQEVNMIKMSNRLRTCFIAFFLNFKSLCDNKTKTALKKAVFYKLHIYL